MKQEELLAEACGIHLGDGYLRNDSEAWRELDISGSMEEKEYYDNHVIPLFSEILDVEIEGRKFKPRNTYGFKIYGKEITDIFIDRLGMPNGKKEEIRVPSFIKNGSEYTKALFLRGLYDTDGYIGFYKRHGNYSKWKKTYHHYPRITFTNRDKLLIKQVEGFLDQISIGYFTRENKRSDGMNYNITSVGETRLDKFMEKIGFRNPVKLTRYKVWRKFDFCPTNTSLEERYKMLSGDLNPKTFY